MDIRRVATTAVFAVLLAGLGAAYLAAFAGLLGFINARAVSLVAITGASVAFIAALIYFADCELRLRRSGL